MDTRKEQAGTTESERNIDPENRLRAIATVALAAGVFAYAAALTLTIAAFSLPARTVAGTWICDDFHGGACAIDILPGGACSMRYESERGTRRGVYDLSGSGTCSVIGGEIVFSWEKADPNGKGLRREAPPVAREVAELGEGGEDFAWNGFTFARMEWR